MGQQAGVHSLSKRAGRHHLPRPQMRLVQFVEMDPDEDDGPRLYWDTIGRLYEDEDLTKPTGLVIVRLPEVG